VKSSFGSATRFVSNFHYAILASDKVDDPEVRDQVANLDANTNELVANLAANPGSRPGPPPAP